MNFRPCPGRVAMYYAPGGRGTRVDSHVYAGYSIPPNYDSMIGKLIAHGKDRREAMDIMSRALTEYMITGIITTIAFEQAILQDPNFRRGTYSTSFSNSSSAAPAASCSKKTPDPAARFSLFPL